MSSFCYICLADLESENAAALCCGHLFHKSCLDVWLEGNDPARGEYVCSLCSQSTPVDKAIWPLFFTKADDAPSAAEVKVAELRRKVAKAKKSLGRVTRQLDLQGERLEKSKYVLRKKTEQEARAQATLRHLKMLPHVSDLNRYMEMPKSKHHLYGLSGLPRFELAKTVEKLRVRYAHYARETDLSSLQHDIAMEQKEVAERRAKALLEELRELKAKSGKEKQVYLDHSPKHEQPSSSKDIIVINSDEDTDDERLFTLDAPKISGGGSSVAAEEVMESAISTRKGKELAVGSRKRDREDDDVADLVCKTRRH